MKLHTMLVLIGIITKVFGEALELDQEFLNGYTKFTGDIYNELKKSNPGNFLVSPLSVDILLSLVEYGSEGETSKQLIKGLSLPENKDILNKTLSTLTPKLNVNDKYTLNSANKIYVKEGRELLEDFKKIAADVYNAEVQKIDFNNKESAVNEMNKWVEQKTHDKIKNIVESDMIDSDTRVVLLNALYFRGDWVTKFNKSQTKNEAFYLDGDNKTQVDLMVTKSDYNYYDSKELNAKFLELPYNGNDVTMTIVLPNEKNGLENLENNIQQVLVTPRYRRERVNVKIPKFKIESKIDFVDVLRNLGITQVFQDTAELGKITGEPLKISKVVQKAVIEVEEEGTTAAASTVAVVSHIRSGHIQRQTKDFIADHAFIYFLKYQSTVLFIGHFTGK